MNKMKFVALCFCTMFGSSSLLFAKPIPISIGEDLLIKYNRLLEDKQTTVFEITDLESIHSSRAVASLIIMLQALKSGGYDFDPEFVVAPNSQRSRVMVANGTVAVSSEDYWSKSFTDKTYKSTAVIPFGEYYKGIYGLPENIELNNIENIGDFGQLSAVSSRGWVTDWHTLSALNLKNLFETSNMKSMVKIVFHRNVDFALLDFPRNTDLDINLADTTLSPVEGVKLGLNDSRHFMVSKNHAEGEKIYAALEAGLRSMHEAGLIKKYYTDVRFYRAELKDWKVLRIN